MCLPSVRSLTPVDLTPVDLTQGKLPEVDLSHGDWTRFDLTHVHFTHVDPCFVRGCQGRPCFPMSIPYSSAPPGYVIISALIPTLSDCNLCCPHLVWCTDSSTFHAPTLQFSHLLCCKPQPLSLAHCCANCSNGCIKSQEALKRQVLLSRPVYTVSLTTLSPHTVGAWSLVLGSILCCLAAITSTT